MELNRDRLDHAPHPDALRPDLGRIARGLTAPASTPPQRATPFEHLDVHGVTAPRSAPPIAAPADRIPALPWHITRLNAEPLRPSLLARLLRWLRGYA